MINITAINIGNTWIHLNVPHVPQWNRCVPKLGTTAVMQQHWQKLIKYSNYLNNEWHYTYRVHLLFVPPSFYNAKYNDNQYNNGCYQCSKYNL